MPNKNEIVEEIAASISDVKSIVQNINSKKDECYPR